MDIFKKIRLFTKYVKDGIISGGRTSYEYMRWAIKDKDERDRLLDAFYIRCPHLPSCGEYSTEKYYLMKDRWLALKDIIECAEGCKRHPFKSLKYIWLTIRDIYYIKDDHRYYMNPTVIRRRKQ